MDHNLTAHHVFEADQERGPPVSLPRVNAVVTCFNYGRFVEQALDSVAAQTYADFDCVVVDDASTDGSAEIIERWISARRDSRFRVIRNRSNLGQMGCFAAALAVTEGEFVAFLDADDVWFPDFLARHIEVHLNRVQPAGASCSDLVQIDAGGRILTGSAMPPALINSGTRGKDAALSDEDMPNLDQSDGLIDGQSLQVKYIFPDWGAWHWSVTSGMVFRRPLVELLMPSDTGALHLGADVYLMSLAHCFAGSFVIERTLGAYRRHGKNNYSSLPVFGSPGSASVTGGRQNFDRVLKSMLEHLLDANDRLADAFSPDTVRQRLRSVFRLFLRFGMTVEDPRLVAVLGRRRVLLDRLQSRIRFLRARLR